MASAVPKSHSQRTMFHSGSRHSKPEHSPFMREILVGRKKWIDKVPLHY
jgi:hypothetical protein